MTAEQRIVIQLRREPCTFVDLCRLSTAEKWGTTYGELDTALVRLREAGRARYVRGAWVTR
jgi:hypothetical protein